MQNRNILIAIAALFIAGIAVFLINSYLTGVEERAEIQADQQRLARIVVATRPLEFGEPLTTENTRLQNFPVASVPEGAFTSIEQALADGRVALRPIVPGEPILASKVSGSDGRAVLSANLPEGKRAVSIAVNQVSGVSGFVRPGDTVDVILTRKIPGEGAEAEDLMSDVILDRVKVLAIDQTASENATEPKVGKTAVLEVDLFQAQQLAIATKIGSLSLALRNVETAESTAGQTITTRDVSKARYYIPARRTAPQMAQANYTPPPGQPGAAMPGAMPMGPSMTIYRGIEGEEYPVSRLGGR